MKETKQKLNPCAECGKVDKISVGASAISCTRCDRHAVSTCFEYIAFTWNYQNQKAETDEV